MSAPQTNLEKQTRRHRPALLGIVAVLAVALIAALVALTRDEPIAEDQAAPAVVDSPAAQ